MYVIFYYIVLYTYIFGDVYQAQQKSSGCPGSLTCACVARCKGRINKVLVGTTPIKNQANKKWSYYGYIWIHMDIHIYSIHILTHNIEIHCMYNLYLHSTHAKYKYYYYYIIVILLYKYIFV